MQTHLKTNRLIVEKALHVQRYREEKVQLLKEMETFLAYCRNSIAQLQERLRTLSAEFTDDATVSHFTSNDAAGRYCLTDINSSIARGLAAMLKAKILQTKTLLRSAASLFQTALGPDSSSVLAADFADSDSEADNDSENETDGVAYDDDDDSTSWNAE